MQLRSENPLIDAKDGNVCERGKGREGGKEGKPTDRNTINVVEMPGSVLRLFTNVGCELRKELPRLGKDEHLAGLYRNEAFFGR